MEAKWVVLLTAALAPIAWGSGYYVTDAFLPPDRPLFGAAVRALPMGILLVLLRRRLPTGVWWWRSAVLGILNVGAFFVLIFISAYRLPSGLAATLTAVSPLALILAAWGLVGERPTLRGVGGAVLGFAGVALLVLGSGGAADPLGVAAAIGSVALFAVGSLLSRRWPPPVDLLTFTGWQLVAGGLFLVPVAVVVEGAPPPIDGAAVGGYLYLGLVATGLAYVVWFRGVRELPAAAIGVLGLLNPVTGTVLGVLLAGESFGLPQAAGTLLVLTGIAVGQGRRGRAAPPGADPEPGEREHARPVSHLPARGA